MQRTKIESVVFDLYAENEDKVLVLKKQNQELPYEDYVKLARKEHTVIKQRKTSKWELDDKEFFKVAKRVDSK